MQKKNWYFDPAEIAWSSNFTDGQTKPFTNRYDSLMNLSCFEIKAKETFKPNLLELRNIQ